MRTKRARVSIPPIGATSLLTVFAVLCLTVFALLTLSDVRSDARLADVSQGATQAYYAADAQAQEILARLRAGESPQGVAFSDTDDPDSLWDRRCTYTVPVSDTLELRVEADLAQGGDYRIVRWQMVSTQAWQEEAGGLNLWNGELP